MLTGLVPRVLHREGGMESNKSLFQMLAEGGGRRGSLGILTHLRPQKHRNDLQSTLAQDLSCTRKSLVTPAVTGGQAGFCEC